MQSSRPNSSSGSLLQGMGPPLGSYAEYEAWMDTQAGAICRGEWDGWPCESGFGLLRDAVVASGADQGALWLVDDWKHELRPCFSSARDSDRFLQEIRQPLSSGLISMVFFTEHAICEAHVGSRSEYCSDIDSRLGARTQAMVAIPIFFAQRCRGIFSAVIFSSGTSLNRKEAFLPADFDILSQASSLWSAQMDSQLSGLAIQIGAKLRS